MILRKQLERLTGENFPSVVQDQLGHPQPPIQELYIVWICTIPSSPVEVGVDGKDNPRTTVLGIHLENLAGE